MNLLKAVILAAGRGTRLGSIGKSSPKCLLKIGENTILEHTIEVLRGLEVSDISLVVGTKGTAWNQRSYDAIKQIQKKSRIRLFLNYDNDFTHSLYSLYLFVREIRKSSLLVIDGDVFFTPSVLNNVLSATYDSLIVSRRANNVSESGTKVVADETGRVINMKNNTDVQSCFIYSGIAKISKNSYAGFREILSNKEYFSFIIGYALDEFSRKYPLYNLEVNQGWVNINTPNDIEKAKQLVQDINW